MISTSIDPEDVEKAKSMSEISEYIVKPITEKTIDRVVFRKNWRIVFC